MLHWTDPASRGAYDHPAAPPPRPQHHAANGISDRLARVEEHLSFRAADQMRMDREGRMRAMDMARAIQSLHERLLPLERTSHTRRQVTRMALRWSRLAGSFMRYAIAGGLVLLLTTGKASVESVKLILGVLGLAPG